jgi:hypothetical protein
VADAESGVQKNCGCRTRDGGDHFGFGAHHVTERHCADFAQKFLKFGEVVDGADQHKAVIAGNALKGAGDSGIKGCAHGSFYLCSLKGVTQ